MHFPSASVGFEPDFELVKRCFVPVPCLVPVQNFAGSMFTGAKLKD
jgi:hypothetical protein